MAWQKLSILFLIILFWAGACQTTRNDTNYFVSTAQLVPTIATVPLRTPAPYTDLIAPPVFENPVVGITWAGEGLGGTASFYISKDGVYEFGIVSLGGISNQRSGTIPKDRLAQIRNDLLTLDPQNLDSILYGDRGVTVQVETSDRPHIITCGNRNCPVAVRDAIWFGLEDVHSRRISPFRDEKFIQLEGLSDFPLLIWYNDLALPPQGLRVNKDRTLETFLLYPYSPDKLLFTLWQIKYKEFETMTECIDSLKTHPSVDNGDDLEVIKLAYSEDGERYLLRLDKKSPPDCLSEMMALAQSTLEREVPDAPLAIRPFPTK